MPMILAGLAAMAAGLFMPWVTATAVFVGQISRNGLSTDDGKLIGVGAVLMLCMAFGDIAKPRAAGCIFILIVSLIVLIAVLADHGDIANRVADINSNPYGSAEVGYGLYVTGAGAVLAAIGAFARLRSI